MVVRIHPSIECGISSIAERLSSKQDTSGQNRHSAPCGFSSGVERVFAKDKASGAKPETRSTPRRLRQRSGGIVNRRAERKSLSGLQLRFQVVSGVGGLGNSRSARKMIRSKDGLACNGPGRKLVRIPPQPRRGPSLTTGGVKAANRRRCWSHRLGHDKGWRGTCGKAHWWSPPQLWSSGRVNQATLCKSVDASLILALTSKCCEGPGSGARAR